MLDTTIPSVHRDLSIYPDTLSTAVPRSMPVCLMCCCAKDHGSARDNSISMEASRSCRETFVSQTRSMMHALVIDPIHPHQAQRETRKNSTSRLSFAVSRHRLMIRDMHLTTRHVLGGIVTCDFPLFKSARHVFAAILRGSNCTIRRA
jgi:hypothetical protein